MDPENRLASLPLALGWFEKPDEHLVSGTGLLGGKQWKMATLDAGGQKSILADTLRWIMTKLPWERQILFYQPSPWTLLSLNPLSPSGLRCRLLYSYPNTWGHICNQWQSWSSFCLVLAACSFSAILFIYIFWSSQMQLVVMRTASEPLERCEWFRVAVLETPLTHPDLNNHLCFKGRLCHCCLAHKHTLQIHQIWKPK